MSALPWNPPATVLVVDDDPASAEALAEVLRATFGCAVATAEDGAMALDLAAELKPDAIVMDIQMPGVGGLEACRIVRRLYRGRMPTVIALTGLSGDDDRRAIIESGFDAHLVKPVDLDRLTDLLAHRPRP
jgi:CheY-like chemotaxis protein